MATEKKPERQLPDSRKGKVIINVYANPAVRNQLKIIALEQNTSAQAIIFEAFNMVFKKYGKEQIA